MEIVARKRAQEIGLKHYYNGEICKSGHLSPRFTSSGNCITCVAIRTKLRIKIKCEFCGAITEVIKRGKKQQQRFCNSKCHGATLRQHRYCMVCNGNLPYMNKEFCSKKCYGKFRVNKKLPDHHIKSLSLAKKGKPIKHLIANKEAICKKISAALTGKAQPWNRGAAHPNYIDGGKAQYQRQKAMGRVEYKSWRRAIFERDDFTCQICFIKGGKLNADHIKPWASYPNLRYDLNNGLTLCVACHRKTPTYGGRSKLNEGNGDAGRDILENGKKEIVATDTNDL